MKNLKFLNCILLVKMINPSMIAWAQPPKGYKRPADVTRFINKREICEHFRGEEAYDKEREKYLEKKIKETCAGTDKELAELRKKYRDNLEVLGELFIYDDKVE